MFAIAVQVFVSYMKSDCLLSQSVFNWNFELLEKLRILNFNCKENNGILHTNFNHVMWKNIFIIHECQCEYFEKSNSMEPEIKNVKSV